MAYSPATMLSTNPGLAHALNYYLTRKALDNLVTRTIFMRPCEKFTLPKNNGKTLRMFRYGLMTPSTTANANEGTVGTGLTVSSRVLDCSVAQYDDFISYSDFHLATDIANTTEEYARVLSIRAAVSVDTIVRTMFDNESATNTPITLTGSSFGRKDLSTFRTKLQGSDVQPMSDGNFLVILHPNITYDLTNDPIAGSLMDVAKYTNPQNAALQRLEDRGLVTTTSGCKVYESTNVLSPSAGVYRVYAFGDRCAGVVNLGDLGPNQVEDPKNERFSVRNVTGGQASITDPTGVIGGLVSYKFYFGTTVLDGPAGIGGTYRFKMADPTTTIV